MRVQEKRIKNDLNSSVNKQLLVVNQQHNKVNDNSGWGMVRTFFYRINTMDPLSVCSLPLLSVKRAIQI